MKNLPTILEEEGKMFDDIWNERGDIGLSKQEIKSFLLASHKRVLGEVVKMVERKRNWYSGDGNKPIRNILDDILSSLQEDINTNI